MVEFYNHRIAMWMDGTQGLSDGAYRAYHVIVQLIYLHDGPITFNERGLAARCNQHVLAFRRFFKELTDSQKLAVVDGKVHNRRATDELSRIATRRERKAQGSKAETPDQPPRGPPGVRRGSGEGLPSKSLKNKDPTFFDSEPKKEREESEEPNGSSAEDPLADLYKKGKAIMGTNSGGLIRKLVASKNGNIGAARRAIEDASTTMNPREYVAAIASGRRAMIKNAFAAMAAQGAMEDADGGDDGGDHVDRALPGPT